MPRPFPHPHHQAGFSLLEMAAVLTIIAILTAGTLSVGSSVIESAREVSTNNKLDAIQEALLAFRLANNRLPCPGDATLTDIAANANTYGYEAGYNAANNPANSCNGGSPTANYFYALPSPPSNTNIPGGTTIAEGAVPVKSLGLPDEFQYDGWGRKFAYTVWTPLTATNAFNTYGVYPSCGAITVENAGHGDRTTAGSYTLVSFGANGHGGYLQNGSRYFMGADNADEWTNCHCNASTNVVNSSTNAPATYVEQEPTQTNPNDSYSVFDDIVRYKSRWQMQNAYDTYNPIGLPCWQGFQTSGSGAIVGPSAAVGDINGDGIPDLIIAGSKPAGARHRYVWYVVFGTPSGFPDPLPLSSLNGSNGFELDSPDSTSATPALPIAIGDFNGDGVNDIILGAPKGSPISSASVYVVFGGKTMKKGTPWSACNPCTLDNTGASSSVLNGTNGVEFDDAVNEGLSSSIAAGDINGDGIADIIVGANIATNGLGQSNAGKVYAIFGNNNPAAWSGTPIQINASLINGTSGIEFDGPAANDRAGTSLAVGDINGDGALDLVIGAPNTTVGGSIYTVFGGKTMKDGSTWSSCTAASPCYLSNSKLLNGTNGFELDNASAAAAEVGWSVATGDVNDDGKADIIIGAQHQTVSGNTDAGAAYVVFGAASGWSATPYTLDNGNPHSILNGTNGFELDGTAANDLAGISVAAGDINGDGKADVIVGASGAGATYVVFGAASGWSATPYTLDNAILNGTTGFQLNGGGISVASGDTNADSIADVIVNSGGMNYIYFGHKATILDPWPATPFNLGGL